MREFYRELTAAKKRVVRERDAQMAAAWTHAALTRQKKLPPLRSLLTEKPETRPLSAAEQQMQLEMMSTMYGGKLVPLSSLIDAQGRSLRPTKPRVNHHVPPKGRRGR